jgi:hypothetical protein
MTRRGSLIAFVVVGLMLGYVLAQFQVVQPAHAQQANQPQSRYQISAYAGQAERGVHHGCYVIETATGAVYHVMQGGQAEKVTQLPGNLK